MLFIMYFVLFHINEKNKDSILLACKAEGYKCNTEIDSKICAPVI